MRQHLVTAELTWATSSIFAPRANKPNAVKPSKRPPATGWPMAVQT